MNLHDQVGTPGHQRVHREKHAQFRRLLSEIVVWEDNETLTPDS